MEVWRDEKLRKLPPEEAAAAGAPPLVTTDERETPLVGVMPAKRMSSRSPDAEPLPQE